MDHDAHSAAPSGMRAESELHVDTLGGAPQVSVGYLPPSVSSLCNSASNRETANALSVFLSNNSQSCVLSTGLIAGRQVSVCSPL